MHHRLLKDRIESVGNIAGVSLYCDVCDSEIYWQEGDKSALSLASIIQRKTAKHNAQYQHDEYTLEVVKEIPQQDVTVEVDVCEPVE